MSAKKRLRKKKKEYKMIKREKDRRKSEKE